MLRKGIVYIVLASFLATGIVFPQPAAAQLVVDQLPLPGTLVNPSLSYQPLLIKGLKVHPQKPLQFDFLMSSGDSGLSVGAGLPGPNKGEETSPLRQESERLIKYFLACLTIPENDLWVNLSPYEKDRMIPDNLGQTELGRDLLAQDYILKQLTASLINPNKDLGKAFWERVYKKAHDLYGASEVPVNTFNKVWILADTAKIFEHDNTAYLVSSHLKVMLDEDYLAASKNAVGAGLAPARATASVVPTVSSQIIRDVILPEIEREVNEGKNFQTIRQIFNSFILASWYKKNLKEALLNQVYADKSKLKGVDLDDPKVKEQIYERYLQAYKKGVFNFIKEDVDASTKETVARKYFSGGTQLKDNAIVVRNARQLNIQELAAIEEADLAITADIKDAMPDAAMTSTAKAPTAVKKPNLIELIEAQERRHSSQSSIVSQDGQSTFAVLHYDGDKIGRASGFSQMPAYPQVVSVSSAGQRVLVLIKDLAGPLTAAQLLPDGIIEVLWFDSNGTSYRNERIDKEWSAKRTNNFLSPTRERALVPIFKALWKSTASMYYRKRLEGLIYDQHIGFVSSNNNSTKEGRLAYTEPVIIDLLKGKRNVVIGDVAASSSITSRDLSEALPQASVYSSDESNQTIIMYIGDSYAQMRNGRISMIYTPSEGFIHYYLKINEHPLRPEFEKLYAEGNYNLISSTDPNVDDYMEKKPGRLTVEQADVFQPSLQRKHDLIRIANILRWLDSSAIDIMRSQGISLKEDGYLLLANDDYSYSSQKFSVWQRQGMKLIYIEKSNGNYLSDQLPHEISLAGPIQTYGSGSLTGWVTPQGDLIKITNRRVEAEMADGRELDESGLIQLIEQQDMTVVQLPPWRDSKRGSVKEELKRWALGQKDVSADAAMTAALTEETADTKTLHLAEEGQALVKDMLYAYRKKNWRTQSVYGSQILDGLNNAFNTIILLLSGVEEGDFFYRQRTFPDIFEGIENALSVLHRKQYRQWWLKKNNLIEESEWLVEAREVLYDFEIAYQDKAPRLKAVLAELMSMYPPELSEAGSPTNIIRDFPGMDRAMAVSVGEELKVYLESSPFRSRINVINPYQDEDLRIVEPFEPRMITRAMFDLIENALDEQPDGQITAEIKKADGKITFAVTNNGKIDWDKLRQRALSKADKIRRDRQTGGLYVDDRMVSFGSSDPLVGQEYLRSMPKEELLWIRSLNTEVKTGKLGHNGIALAAMHLLFQEKGAELNVVSDGNQVTFTMEFKAADAAMVVNPRSGFVLSHKDDKHNKHVRERLQQERQEEIIRGFEYRIFDNKANETLNGLIRDIGQAPLARSQQEALIFLASRQLNDAAMVVDVKRLGEPVKNGAGRQRTFTFKGGETLEVRWDAQEGRTHISYSDPKWNNSQLLAKLDGWDNDYLDIRRAARELNVWYAKPLGFIQSAQVDNGGIDLKSSDLKMDIQKKGNGVVTTIDPALIKQFETGQFSGVVPVIINIAPIQGAWKQLGLSPQMAGV